MGSEMCIRDSRERKEMEIEAAYSERDRQVEAIKKVRSRWMDKIIALHKTTGR